MVKLSPKLRSWLLSFRSKYRLAYIKEVMADKKKQMSLMFQLGFIPKEHLNDQISRGEVYEEYEHKKDEEIIGEITERWTEWLLFYQNQLKEKNTNNENRINLMKKSNPCFTLRNYLLQDAIDSVEKEEDTSKMEKLLELSFDPFNREKMESNPEYFKIPPKWAQKLTVSCSS